MATDHQRIDSRSRRLLAYLRHNRDRMIVDAAILATWVLTLSTLFDWFALPSWLFYVVLFAGAVAYTRVTSTWERPYRSPD